MSFRLAAIAGLALAGAILAPIARADIGVPTVPPPPAANPDAAAAKHAKRTACLKDAQMRKLVGAVRDEYVKNCVANT